MHDSCSGVVRAAEQGMHGHARATRGTQKGMRRCARTACGRQKGMQRRARATCGRQECALRRQVLASVCCAARCSAIRQRAGRQGPLIQRFDRDESCRCGDGVLVAHLPKSKAKRLACPSCVSGCGSLGARLLLLALHCCVRTRGNGSASPDEVTPCGVMTKLLKVPCFRRLMNSSCSGSSRPNNMNCLSAS
jgi:hypothetical protein